MSIDKIMRANSVAIIGASQKKTKRGYQAIKILLEEKYNGKIYPVNPKEENILGLKCYASILDIEDVVDMVLITTPAKTVPDILADCGSKGVKGAVIIAGGFGEFGESGKKLEERIISVAKASNVRLIGPNTSGMMNVGKNLNLVGLRNVPTGNIGLLTQSGNIALTLITEAGLKSRQGFSYYVGVGNEADIKFHEYLDFFRRDVDTKAILMYVEGMRQGRKFLQEAYRTTRTKPIILLNSGSSPTGKCSAGSHTGALAGISEVAEGAFRRAGITVVNNPDNLFPVAETLISLPPNKLNTLAILADGGGHATIAADLLTDLGVNLPILSEKTKEKLRKILPATASIRNPVDVAGGTDDNPAIFADCANIILSDPSVGGLLIVGLFGGYGLRFAEELFMIEDAAAHQMGELVKRRKKPIVLHSLFTSAKPHSLEILRYHGIPVYDSLSVACKCSAVLAERGYYLQEQKRHKKKNEQVDFSLCPENKKNPAAQRIINKAREENRVLLLESEVKKILQKHKIPTPPEKVVKTADAAVSFAAGLKCPVVLKIVSPKIVHKSDIGGVRLNLSTESEIRQAFSDIMKKAGELTDDIRGILVAPMAKDGIEIIIGTKIDDQFGPIVMYGLGGVMVEILKDVSFRVLPISLGSARAMLKETKSYELLKGFRGMPPVDQRHIVKILRACSDIMEAYPDILEMDLNPVIVHEKGISVVDARIILKK